MGQNDTIGKIELIPFSMLTRLIVRMTFTSSPNSLSDQESTGVRRKTRQACQEQFTRPAHKLAGSHFIVVNSNIGANCTSKSYLIPSLVLLRLYKKAM